MILVAVNAGSSSLKAAAFEEGQFEDPLATLQLENVTDFTEAIAAVQTWLREHAIEPSSVAAVGHRVVHGGTRYAQATRITPEVLGYLESITPLAPNHLPATIDCITAFQAVFPHSTHVACFDTALFHDLPLVAQALALPHEYAKKGLRRYGFHGLSYGYLLENFRHHEGDVATRGRVIMAHLGSGASIAAFKDGKAVDVSMGFTPTSGIVMSTRSGDLDPGALLYLQTSEGLSPEATAELVTKQSGLLGVSGLSPAMHELLEAQHTNPQAALAIELFCYTAKKTIGGYAAALGGVDSIIFTGGIGERSAEVRQRILGDLEFLGIHLDPVRNEANERLISSNGSGVGVHVIPAREDIAIAQQTLNVYKETTS